MTQFASRSNTSARSARILVVDDHPIVRQGLSLLISKDPKLEVCGEADGMTEAIKQFKATQPDLTVIDISLNDGSGIELIKELMAMNAETKLLVSSMHDESLFAERALRAGAKGYINKEQATDKIIDAIHHVLDGKIYLSERMTNQMLSRTVGSDESDPQSPIEALSDRELEVFEMIGRGVTTRQIADQLFLSPKTVETYRENIKTKLNVENASELTRHAVEWVLEDS